MRCNNKDCIQHNINNGGCDEYVDEDIPLCHIYKRLYPKKVLEPIRYTSVPSNSNVYPTLALLLRKQSEIIDYIKEMRDEMDK